MNESVGKLRKRMGELRKDSIERLCGECKKKNRCKIKKKLMKIVVKYQIEFMLTLCDRFEKKEEVKLSKKK